MCTVTCTITNNQIIFTSSRDIPISRAHSLPPKIYRKNSINILMPFDPQGNGSWIGASKFSIACILNHRGKENSNKSRGKLLYNLLSNEISINQIENISIAYNSFRLIYLDKKNKKYYNCIWDGKCFKSEKIYSNLNIWSSNTIYNQSEIKYKLDFFNSIFNQQADKDELIDFHLNEKNIKNDSNIRTTSVTQIIHNDSVNMYYNDLLNSNDYYLKLSS